MRQFSFFLFLLHFQLIPFSLYAYIEETDASAMSDKLYLEAKELEKKGASSAAIEKYQESLKLAEEFKLQPMVAKNWLAIGEIKILLGEYEQARKILDDAKKIGIELNDQRIVARAMILIGIIHQNQSQYKESMEIGQQAVQMGQELNDLYVLCRAYRLIANTLFYQGQFLEAQQEYQKSLKYAEEMKDSQMISYSLVGIGNTFNDMGDHQQAIQYLRRAIQKAEEAGDKTILPNIYSSIGIAYKQQAMHEEAANYYKRGLRVTDEVGDKDTKAVLLNNLGVVFRIQGLNDQALYYYHQALKLVEELQNLKGVAILLNNIGTIYVSEGRYEEAFSYYERSLRTREQIGDQWGIASVFNNMSSVYEKQKRYDLAITYNQKALKIAEETGNKQRVNQYSQNLGEAYFLNGSYQDAKQQFEKALAVSKENNAKDSIGFALEGLGKVNLQFQKYPEAIEFYQQALSLGEEIKRPDLIWRSRSGLAEVHEKVGNKLLALNFYEAAIDEIENVRARATSEEGKSSFLAAKLDVYENLIRILSEMGKTRTHSEQNFEARAFEYSERARARALLDSLAEARAGIKKGLSKTQGAQQAVILGKISSIQSQLWKASTPREIKNFNQKLIAAEAELDQFILDLRIHNAEYAQLQYPQPYHLNQIQKALDENTALLEFFIGQDQSYVFIVTANSFKMTTLAKRSQLESLVRKFRERISQPPKLSLGQNPESLKLEFQQQARALFQLILGPVKQSIAGKRNWILIPDGILHYLPFETLINEQDRLVIEDFQITYAPSATIWARMKTAKQAATNSKEFLAFADPLLSSDSKTLSDVESESWKRRLGRLHYAANEVKEIASLYPQGLVGMHLAEEATEKRLKDERASDYKIIHFASHAVIDEEVPRRSGIVLSATEKTEEDGVLQMHEIWNLNLNAQLIVLSACQTGLGKLVNGEGIIGLMRSFFYAGAKNVVVSLWNVDDKSTSELMKNFYIQLKSGKPKAESLRQAKLNMIRSAKSGSGYAAYENPYYWGTFILIGPGE